MTIIFNSLSASNKSELLEPTTNFVFFNDVFWGFGRTNRIICSYDNGLSWQSSATNISFTPAFLDILTDRLFIFNNKLHLKTITSLYNSSDGVTWTFLSTLPSGNNKNASVCIHNNRIYLLGSGSSSGSLTNDVRSSSDGVTWTIHSGTKFTARYSANSFSMNGILFICGGGLAGYPWYYQDLWYSEDDGANFTLYSSTILNDLSIIAQTIQFGAYANNIPFRGSVLGPIYGRVYVKNEGGPVGTVLLYTDNGFDWNYEICTVNATFDASFGPYLCNNDNSLYLIGLSHYYNSGALTEVYKGSNQLSSPNNILRFTASTIHSPSPAYIRLTDSSEVYDSLVYNYTRIWSLTNNRTSEQIIFSTSAQSVEVAVEGIWGDTYNVSLSAVWE